ncbi:hypothetical protein [Pseudofrankia saprophytica]|nr:hypothetical protein [Pseudofrankia saprophytica]
MSCLPGADPQVAVIRRGACVVAGTGTGGTGTGTGGGTGGGAAG